MAEPYHREGSEKDEKDIENVTVETVEAAGEPLNEKAIMRKTWVTKTCESYLHQVDADNNFLLAIFKSFHGWHCCISSPFWIEPTLEMPTSLDYLMTLI